LLWRQFQFQLRGTGLPEIFHESSCAKEVVGRLAAALCACVFAQRNPLFYSQARRLSTGTPLISCAAQAEIPRLITASLDKRGLTTE
jgi:hypothetical protein